MFAGRELENFKGKNGFANLLSIKSQYFQHIKKELASQIKKTFHTLNSENELYEKAFTFFDSFLNETGCPYFNKTEFYKNLYEKVYTNSCDTALFYKTSKLYYVKSDSVPSNAEYAIENEEHASAKIIFEVSDELNYSSTNEKKELKFLLKDLNKTQKSITLLVLYKDQKIDLGDDYSFELNAKMSEKEYELISSNKTNIKKFDALLVDYALDITPNEVAQAIHTYKKQREIDFFIHKDAGSFLKEQFNLYIYNYLFHDNEIQFNDWDSKRLQQIKNIKEIIFSTIELIAKFEDELRAMWLKSKFVRGLNYIITLDKIDSSYHDAIFEVKEQVNEWKELGLLKEDELLSNEFLPVDTKYLGDDLKYKILSSFDTLDEVTDGVLIKSDNFQALNTILPKYKGLIDLIYIDPPFNTGSDFAYKDRFQDSTWLTLMENRLSLSRDFLSEKGNFFLHLDDKANHYGKQLLNSIFSQENYINEIIWCYSGGGVPKDRMPKKHDIIYWYANQVDDKYYNPVYREYSEGTMERGRTAVKGENAELREEGTPVNDWWTDIKKITSPTDYEKQNFATQKSEELLERIIAISSIKDSFVMDYFGGSGTTINTAHKLGRRWIGVEMGSHFESVNIPRIKRTLAGVISGISKELEKENNLKKGGIVKYYSLESYEDVLSKAKYALNKENLIDLYQSEKMATEQAIKIDDEGVRLDVDAIYDDIDIYETISNITGFTIKKCYADRCLFLDAEQEVEIQKNALFFSEYPFLRKLVWWKS